MEQSSSDFQSQSAAAAALKVKMEQEKLVGMLLTGFCWQAFS